MDPHPQDGRPTLGRRQSAIDVAPLRPRHPKTAWGGANDTGDIDGHLHLADLAERIMGSGVVAERRRATIGREVVGGEPVLAQHYRIGRFQREASDARGALATIKELRAARAQMADRERAIVATMEGAVHADLFEAQRRNVDHFEQAYVCARRAFAADPNGEEVKALYRRLDSLAPKRP